MLPAITSKAQCWNNSAVCLKLTHNLSATQRAKAASSSMKKSLETHQALNCCRQAVPCDKIDDKKR